MVRPGTAGGQMPEVEDNTTHTHTCWRTSSSTWYQSMGLIRLVRRTCWRLHLSIGRPLVQMAKDVRPHLPSLTWTVLLSSCVALLTSECLVGPDPEESESAYGEESGSYRCRGDCPGDSDVPLRGCSQVRQLGIDTLCGPVRRDRGDGRSTAGGEDRGGVAGG